MLWAGYAEEDLSAGGSGLKVVKMYNTFECKDKLSHS